MLTIRDSQMKLLLESMAQTFEDRVMEHVKEFFAPEATALGETKLREAIAQGIEKAEGYGIESERDQVQFVDLKFALHMNFDEDDEFSWIGEILNDASLSGGDKIALICAELPDRPGETRGEELGEGE